MRAVRCVVTAALMVLAYVVTAWCTYDSGRRKGRADALFQSAMERLRADREEFDREVVYAQAWVKR